MARRRPPPVSPPSSVLVMRLRKSFLSVRRKWNCNQPPRTVATSANLLLLARVAPTCTEKTFCEQLQIYFAYTGLSGLEFRLEGGRSYFLTLPNVKSRHRTVSNAQDFHRSNGLRALRASLMSSRHIAESSRIKVNQGNYSQIKPPTFSPPNLNPKTRRFPGCRLRTPIVTNCHLSKNTPTQTLTLHRSADSLSAPGLGTLTPLLRFARNPTKPKVAHCRFSKIRPKTSPLNLEHL
jgi:hypothetical protein